MEKRKLQVAVISDLHLGTYGCQAKSIIHYLRSIETEILVLNGDIIDMWQFSKHYFPESHMQVIREILAHLAKGTKVYYITGNHDDRLRSYTDLELGQFVLTDKLVLTMDGKRAWIFHGDVFDATTQGSARIIAKLGGAGYSLLILMNQAINWTLALFGREKMSFSKKIKNAVKKAVTWIQNFEDTAATLAIEKGYDFVICGHIHQPTIQKVYTIKGEVTYLNSGDWVENCTALEYINQEWSVHTHNSARNSDIVYENGSKIKVPDVAADIISHLMQPAS